MGPSQHGSARTQAPNEANVLVTGFAVSAKSDTKDASMVVSGALPSMLHTNHAHPTRCRIIHHPEPVGASYGEIDDFMSSIHDARTRYDIILHIGVAEDNVDTNTYTLETTASRDIFKIRDLADKLPEDLKQPIFWKSSPPQIKSRARIVDVMARWSGEVPKRVKVVSSDNAGKYLSEYLYYSSLAYFLHARNNNLPWYERTTVALMLVPPSTTQAMVEQGREVVSRLIYALVDSRRSRNGDSDEDYGADMIMYDGEI